MDDIQKYVEITKKEMAQLVSIILGSKYDRNIFKEFLTAYTDTRYYNIKGKIKEKNELRKVVLSELQQVKRKLYKIYDKSTVNNMGEVFEYISYFDDVGKYKDINTILNNIIEFRELKLGKQTDNVLLKTLKKQIEQSNKTKQEYLEKFESNVFKLRSKKVRNNLFVLTLKHNIKFSDSYSASIIEEVYNSKVTKEDKLSIEYHMLNSMIIKDIIKGNFKKDYVVEFATTLVTKKSKLTRVIKIIENENIQEKIHLLIDYKEFNEETKHGIYDLMRQGYKIAIKLDETFKTNEAELEKLNVFSYILANEKQDYYKEVSKNKQIAKKIVKI